MNIVLEDSVPEWFYSLSATDRNTIYNSALTEYESVTSAKNTSFLTYWTNLMP